MKRISLLILATLVLAMPCLAQTDRVAFIDTSTFNDRDQGLTRLVKAVRGVEEEFKPRLEALMNRQWRLQQQFEPFPLAGPTLGPIPSDPRPMTPERKLAIREQMEAIKREFERQQKELETALNRRMQEVVSPIFEDIRKNLESFTRKRGITMLIDAGQSTCRAGDCSSMSRLDVTREFVSEYNRLNP